ncbi:cysteine hydrolase family protein [Maritimibacter alkaliphilus]|uniref:cysteine hydrolase family protein n=1 Tax=Maritimibacter alkaliphilus TaxID=404236 RepID=UPI001C974DBB|nr:isochorismatase family cysteine hydrolase [Maritimibacter alkaliphilus]MBY6088921.1 cysteine hydrolase [Maritimibacter alkaliphilus]
MHLSPLDFDAAPDLPPVMCPALVVVDMQNDFLLPGAPMECAEGRAILPGLAGMIAAFRAAGLPVVFLRFTASTRFDPLAERMRWIRTMAAPVHACQPGHLRRFDDGTEAEGFAIHAALAPLPGEAVVDKDFFGGFHETGFDARLRALGADMLCITGVLTEMCVEDTARQAVHHGYPTALIRDLVASSDPVAAEATLRAFGRHFGWVLSAAEVTAAIRTETPA